MPKKDFKHRAAKKRLSDDDLLDLVQKQTLKYVWSFGHPDCGMVRERSNADSPAFPYDLDTVTTGGTGFGIMAMVAGAERGFLKKDGVRNRVDKIVNFLEKSDKFHGVFPHFLNGKTGKTVAFSEKDDGGDLVETSFLMMGLLTARQYFSGDSAEEKALRDKINKLWEAVEWDWHTTADPEKLMWHWSPNHGFDIGLPLEGWNEALVTHVLAFSSPTHPVDKKIYDEHWPSGAHFKNGQDYDGIKLPLGPPEGGPLFFAHYSFMGIAPKDLKDKHADYWEQNRNHTLINRAHCIKNPHGYKGYGENCWGLTAGDNHEGYAAHSPTEDKGVIAPTAALSSMPYTPKESMQVLRHLYEDLGDKLWGKYGFHDGFNETEDWYADSYLAIDQGPIAVMIENHRSGLLWDLFMSCPEVKNGMKGMGFSSPYLDDSPKAQPRTSAAPRHKPS
ncbi:MAG: beta-glucosidase [Micavibrio sp.]|nr:MAG: beta-glucosidase [Micavibrio sp.]